VLLVRGVVGSSGWDTAPVLARLCCFGCSLSEGERERERFLLESDIAGIFSARFDQDSEGGRPMGTKSTRGGVGLEAGSQVDYEGRSGG
jgi:hypothetical protein